MATSCFASLTNRAYEGYMKYHDNKVERKNYYFVLSNNFLCGAKSIHSSKLSVIVPIVGKTVKLDPTNHSKFIVYNKKRTLYFKAPSIDIASKWIEAIHKASNWKITDIYRLISQISGTAPNPIILTAEHRKSKQKLAIKVITKKVINSKKRISNQLGIMKSLQTNPYIIGLHDVL